MALILTGLMKRHMDTSVVQIIHGKIILKTKKNDPVATYQERFSRDPEIVNSSDPEKITVLNDFAYRLNIACQNDDIEQLIVDQQKNTNRSFASVVQEEIYFPPCTDTW
ncbi:MAG: hypothetical protein HZB65_04915 [Candidatus Aenigmarchaeota archaeon]|nr:hypothetical protein [Candidatus Aenigmarchaeota archaeon]